MVIPTKEAERSACCISCASGRTNDNNTVPLSPPLRYGEPQKQNLPFPFSKKLGGAKKRIKTQRQNFVFVGSL
ncbi:hypothetical protein KKH46_00810 [Patescibacteria group bacterium]|nr:hypothetical protein [Patescibacteria group bacterium]MBU1956549.1 hypothetical protein [Patescibacteria group bacterium]